MNDAHNFDWSSGNGQFHDDLRPAWDFVCAAHSLLIEHITGAGHHPAIELIHIVRAFHAATVATGTTGDVHPVMLTKMFGRWPDGAFFHRVGTDSFAQDVGAIWQQCNEALRQEKLKSAITLLGIWNAGHDDYVIPLREWLLGNSFCKQFLSSLLADGGVGKTALRVAQIFSLVTNRKLTSEHVFRRCRCLILSFEDSRDELRRRVYATMLHYNIKPADVDGWLFLAAPKGLKLAKMVEGSLQADALEKLLREAIATLRLDIVCLDPFIKTHSVGENDNNAIDFVCDLLATIAIDLNCAIDFPHHTNKGLATPGDANRGRGASSAKDAARLVYTLTPMTPDEGALFGLDETNRRSLVRMDSAKVNITPPSTEATWFRLIGQPLRNATPEYPKGDNIQTVEPWEPPKTWAGLDAPLLNRILDAIDAGMPNGQRFSAASPAKARAAWRVVQEHAPDKPEKACRAIINAWKDSGTLFDQEYDDPTDHKIRVGLKVNATKRPT